MQLCHKCSIGNKSFIQHKPLAKTIKMYLHFLLYLSTEIVQVSEILSYGTKNFLFYTDNALAADALATQTRA